MPNTTKRENVTDALEDIRKHHKKISRSPIDAQKENFSLLKTLKKYSELFDRHGLTNLKQMLEKSCIDYSYIDELIWLDRLECVLQWIIMSNGAKPEQEDAAISPDDARGHDCEQCPDKDFCPHYALKRSLLEQLVEEVRWAQRNPWMRFRAICDWEFVFWMNMSISILKKNGINISSRDDGSRMTNKEGM